jgi:hypothetical protein
VSSRGQRSCAQVVLFVGQRWLQNNLHDCTTARTLAQRIRRDVWLLDLDAQESLPGGLAAVHGLSALYKELAISVAIARRRAQSSSLYADREQLKPTRLPSQPSEDECHRAGPADCLPCLPRPADLHRLESHDTAPVGVATAKSRPQGKIMLDTASSPARRAEVLKGKGG